MHRRLFYHRFFDFKAHTLRFYPQIADFRRWVDGHGLGLGLFTLMRGRRLL
jgi:hypothetical protein